MSGAAIWLILFAAFMIFEMITMSLTTLWLAGGALAAAAAYGLGAPLWLQLVLFAAVSPLLLFLLRPVAVKYFNTDRVQASARRLIGRQVIVISEINNRQGTGQVTVDGKEWSAGSIREKEVLPVGSVAVVREVKGMRLIVEEKQTGI